MFNPSSDLLAIQNILIADEQILLLLNLTGKKPAEIVKRIICKSKWNTLVKGERRLCVYFRPSRVLRNQAFTEDVLQFDCHVPADDDLIAYRVMERIKQLFHKSKINNRYLYFDGQLGELPTLPDFFCCGSRFVFNRNIN